MAFWGIEVRPGKPYTLLRDDPRGRLRVCQAALGIGKGESNSVLQCTVCNKSPILLCSLIPNVSEMIRLGLEFEEDGEVVFSVLGEESIHLTGYFLGSNVGAGGDETDSYAEDTGEAYSGIYDCHDSEEVVIKEIVEYDNPSNGNANHQCSMKKPHISDTNDGDHNAQHQLVIKSNSPAVLEGEDKDGFPISFSLKKKPAAKDSEENVNSDDRTTDGTKRKIEDNNDPESARKVCQPCDSSLLSAIHTEKNGMSKKKQKFKVQKTPENGSKSSAGKLKKLKKDTAKKGKTSETGTKFSAERTEGATGDASEVTNTDGREQDHPVGPDKPSNYKDVGSGKQKKKNKKKSVKDGISQMKGRLQVENRNTLQISSEDVGKTHENLLVRHNDSQQDAKKKNKKKSRNQDKYINANQDLSNLVEKENKAEPLKTWTSGNGLTIVELVKGKPNGKRASPWCKVCVLGTKEDSPSHHTWVMGRKV